ncbi:hypothetical protein AVT98_gp56 [Sulfolobales virus YNP1]|uniref:hypothetical protein n=1 Tax=Sulfolobales virus YNP1 TaxID=1732179 RepID=UPI0007067F35|nr:hypothetical protein AVT98_gp56 [Sulfolobales virus YNP1]ALG97148.1 hypothetical protein [Sulfolobales virus YNP1]
MTDIVKIVKQLISNNPSLKQKLIEQGIISERDGDIVILKPEAFEILSSNSAVTDSVKQTPKSIDPPAKIKIENEKNTNLADMAGEKHEWLKQSDFSIDPPAKIKIENEKNSNSERESVLPTKNPPADRKNTNSPAASKKFKDNA